MSNTVRKPAVLTNLRQEAMQAIEPHLQALSQVRLVILCVTMDRGRFQRTEEVSTVELHIQGFYA
eukprot:1950385-Amphidinium_carterae.1